MARQYRTTAVNLDKNLGNNGEAKLCFSVRPIDAEQAPGGYLKSVKVSVHQRNQDDNPQAYLIAASANDEWDDTQGSNGDIITAAATGLGGGTVWLNLRRTMKSYTEEVERPDGPIYIHVRALDMGLVGDSETDLIAEVWGRFIMLGAH